MLFDTAISVRGQRKSRKIALTLDACMVDDGMGDPLNQSATASDMDAMSFYVRRDDWSEFESPQVGDLIMLEDGDVYSVRKVGRLADVWVLSSRRK